MVKVDGRKDMWNVVVLVSATCMYWHEFLN